MRNNIFLKYIILIVVNIILIPQITMATDQLKWEALIGMYSGRENPSYKFETDEVNTFKNMINTKMKETSRIAANDKRKHQGKGQEFAQYEPDSGYMGTHVIAVNNSNEIVEYYFISGKYIRVSSEGGSSSKLYKMQNNEIEEYLIQLANEKGATTVREQQSLIRNINKRDHNGIPYRANN